ncbi:hypothetical protein BB987_03945 [Photorhabdus temperata]|uniref:Uncharacterized protein n=1 Tax=Photorhabdus stackebrandtii TaxID=1123042 RepID=A0A7X5QM35_9GAMM|nr:hypothetical protein [Photorhabdus stackebrandtii]OHV58810.1 hypothetical protein BB987_03945 [Photorhabdus temperata]
MSVISFEGAVSALMSCFYLTVKQAMIMGGELHPCLKILPFIIITDRFVFKTFRVLVGVGMPF